MHRGGGGVTLSTLIGFFETYLWLMKHGVVVEEVEMGASLGSPVPFGDVGAAAVVVSGQQSLGTGGAWVVGPRGRRGYFQFDVSEIDGPVTSATLRFHSHGIEGDRGVGSAYIERVDDDGGLNETVGYGSVPESGASISQVVTGLDDATRNFEIEITDLEYLQSQIDGDGTFSTALRIDVEGGVNSYVGMRIASREFGVRNADYTPILTITTGSPPPPPAITLQNFDAGDVLTDAVDPVFQLRDVTFGAEEPLEVVATAGSIDVGLRLPATGLVVGRVERSTVDWQTLQFADLSDGSGATIQVTGEDPQGQTRTWMVEVPASGEVSVSLSDAAGLTSLRIEVLSGDAALTAVG